MAFLRMDCKNMLDFWKRKYGLLTLTPQQLFFFITADNIANSEQAEAELDRLLTSSGERNSGQTSVTDSVSERVFMQTDMPRSLAEFDNEEELQRKLRSADTEPSFHKAMDSLCGTAQNEEENETVSNTVTVATEEDRVENETERDTVAVLGQSDAADATTAEEARLAEIMRKLQKWENRIAISQEEEEVTNPVPVAKNSDSEEEPSRLSQLQQVICGL